MESFVASLSGLLTTLVQAQDSETIKNVTTVLNTQFYVTCDCIPALIDTLSLSPYFQVRQLAAVELRKRIGKWWSYLQEAFKKNCRSRLLSIVLEEQNQNVSHSTAQVISSIASIPDEKWPGLVDFLNQSCTSSNKRHRETVMPSHFMNPALFNLLDTLIVDQESKQIRVTTVLVWGKLSEYVDSQDKETIKIFKNTFPCMINVLKQCIEEGDTDSASNLFEVFNALLMLNTPLLLDHLSNLISFFLTISSDAHLDDEIRILALSALMWAAIYKSNKIKKLNLIEPILKELMLIGTEEEPEDIDQDSPSRLAFKVWNTLATHIGPRRIFGPTISLVLDCIQQNDPKFRKASMMAFAAIVEGCTDQISLQFNELFPLVCSGLQDIEIKVRRAACMALGCLAEDLPVEISEHHATLLPLVLNLMDDTHSEATKHACASLNVILEDLGIDVVQYLPLLMEKLIFLLSHKADATVLAAIGSAAHAAGKYFAPYFMQTIPVLIQYMSTTTGESDYLLRGIASDTAGSIAQAVPDAFRPYLPQIMHHAVKQLHFKSTRLRESSFALFGTLARVFGQEFSPFLSTVVPELLQTSRSEDATMDEFENYDFPLADEKELAADALGELFASTRHAFLPYLDESLVELQKLTGHLYDGVRRSATQSLFTFLKTVYGMSDSNVPSVQNLIDMIVPMTVEFWKEEENRSVVAQTCEELTCAISLIGPVVVYGCLEEVCQYLLEIYQKSAICQQALDEEDDDDEEDDEESETVLMGSVGDLVAALCQAVGPNFSSSFHVFLPYILNHCKPRKSPTERSMAIGCLGECIVGIKSAITPYTEKLLQLFVSACSDKDELVRGNAAFSLGCLNLYTQVDLSTHYPQFLTLISSLLNDQAVPNTVDNAIGAIARLIIAHPESVPLDQVLPVFIQLLPLKVDFEENEPIFECIFKLFSANNPFVFKELSRFLDIFTHVLCSNEQLSQATRDSLIELVRALNIQRRDMNIASSKLACFL